MRPNHTMSSSREPQQGYWNLEFLNAPDIHWRSSNSNPTFTPSFTRLLYFFLGLLPGILLGFSFASQIQ